MYVRLITLLAATTTIQERPLWRWAFYINLCVSAICAPVYLFLLPNKDPHPGVSLQERANTMDHIRGILTIGAIVTGVMAVSFGVVPIKFFKSQTVLILFTATAARGTTIFIPMYMAPLYFQFTRGDSTLESSVRLLPFIILMIMAVMTNGALLSKFSFAALMYTVGLTTSVAHVYSYTILIGVGVGFFAQASFSITQATMAPELVPSAVSFISLAQITGITLALAIANAVFFNKSVRSLKTILPGVDPG
ncbi:hypothetical protein CNMCM8686_001075 [Aspergillus fumigatus]|nr:hypothetical protein CNMCM8686_001075 [Aspergillus fumigatus]